MTESPPKLPGHLRRNDALFLFGSLRPKPWVLAYEQPYVEIVGGPSCKPEKEILPDATDRDGVAVRQRRGGGGTVVLSPGMVITVVVGRRKRDDVIRDIFGRVHEGIIRVCAELKLPTPQHRGLSDLAVGERKILGSSLYLSQRPFLYYYQSSLMVDPDMSLLDRYLKHPPREPDYRKGRSHTLFCTSLRQEGYPIQAAALAHALQRKLPGLIGDTERSQVREAGAKGS